MKKIYEIRDEYAISLDRKKLWDIEISMLKDIDLICKEKNLQYFLHGGAGLGTMRHQGFIPWDDDLDIGMPRDSFEKFVIIFSDRFGDKYSIQYGYGQYEECGTFLRIRDRHSTAIIKYQWENKKMCHGIFVEIYPFDHSVNSTFLRNIQANNIEMYERILNHRFCQKKFSGFKGILDYFFNRAISTKYIWSLWNKECQKYNKYDTKWCDTTALPKYFREGVDHYKIKDVFPTVNATFEHNQFPIPANNDAVLKIEYGDYMQLPPLEERGKNHDRLVFFDPNRCYLEYLNSDIPDQYFQGKIDNLI